MKFKIMGKKGDAAFDYDEDIRYKILRTIGGCIDEEAIQGCADSFIEMDEQVINATCNGQTEYFKVTLTECSEEEYFKPIDLGEIKT